MDYQHILTGAAANLPTATCAYWDDIRHLLAATEIVSITESVFAASGQTPAIVDVREVGQDRSKRYPYQSFVRKCGDLKIADAAVYAKAQDALSEIWTPPAYASFRLDERVKFLGVYASPGNVDLFASEEIARMAAQLDAGAAYRFSYPLVFSPAAYIDGLSFAPNQRAVGSLARRDEMRVSNYRDHRWRGNHAHQGFFRDLYELIVFRKSAADRMVGASRLLEWIAADQSRGTVQRHQDLYLWTTDAAEPKVLQSILDGEHILLSGFEPQKIREVR